MISNFHQLEQVKVVSDFHELLHSEFFGKTNAFCLERNLEGDFEELVSQLQLKENITEISPDDLLNLKLSDSGNLAREIVIKDYQLLLDFGAQPSLNLLKSYEEDHAFDFISTDVYSYHVDQSPIVGSTFLCTYFGMASDILPNNQAIKSCEIPEIRDKLKSLFQNSKDSFEDFLKENFFNLHYEALPSAKSINLGKGNIWRLAIDHPEMKVLPCIHRAPKENGTFRLMLIC
jgi:hypothetical protein